MRRTGLRSRRSRRRVYSGRGLIMGLRSGTADGRGFRRSTRVRSRRRRRGGGGRCGALWRRIQVRRCNRIRRGGCFLRELCHGYHHRLLHRNSHDALALIDPAIGRDRGQLFLVQSLELFGPDLGPFLLIAVSARRCANYDQRQQPEKGEEKHHTDPRRKQGARLEFFSWFVGRHG